jgi:pimeloyl-ACP methyl ester carboxylesterase
MPHWATHVELLWEEPNTARFLRRLSSLGRLILFDRRGMGLSDPVPESDIDSASSTQDLVSVLNAVQSDRVVLVASDGAGFGAVMFAAEFPERVDALVLVNTTARIASDTDYPEGIPARWKAEYLGALTENWANGPADVHLAEPSMVDDLPYRNWLSRYQLGAARPSTIAAVTRAGFDSDVRGLLPQLRVRTLVVHREGDLYFPVQHGRYLAQHIPEAKYVELPGADHTITVGDQVALLDEIELFLVGQRTASGDRILGVMLFTDIVESTQHAVTLGDQAWRDLLDLNDAEIRRCISQYRGREIFTKGDEFVALFATPSEAIQCGTVIRSVANGHGLHVRVGIHAGELESRGQDVAGIALHVGSRIQTAARPDEILVSRTVADLVGGSPARLVPRGSQQLRGVPGEWELWEAEPLPGS